MIVKNLFVMKLVIICIVYLAFITPQVIAEDKKTIAILPFEMISNDDISYLQEGILQMLHSRLHWADKVIVIKKRNMEELLKTIDKKTTNPVQDILARTHTDYVLTGNITQFANAFSIDAKILDVKNSQSLSFFDQSNTIDQVIPKLNTIAAKINYKIFNRETTDYLKLTNEAKDKAKNWERQNPEELMPSIPHEKKEKSSWWKVWEYL